MPDRPPVYVDWVLDDDASSDEVDSVKQIALEEGLPGPVTATYFRKSIGDLPWQIIILTPAIPFLKGFLEEAGRSSFKHLYRLVSRLFAARRKGNGYVQVVDRDSLTTIVFTRDLPEDAFKQLAHLGSENIVDKYWVWDPEQQCWKCQSVRGE